MKKTIFNAKLSLVLCSVLFAAALNLAGCSDDEKSVSDEKSDSVASQSSQSSENGESADDNVLGEGNTVFDFVVVDENGEDTVYEIHTDETVVGDALQELGLIEGEDGDYGLYVKTVDGITVDFDKDGKYWAFYIDDEYAMSGVDSTDIVAGSEYCFKVEE